MYIPHHFVEHDQELIESFIRKHSFGTLVTYDGSRPVASQLLFHLSKGRHGGLQLLAHMARNNPQWKTFDAADEALVLFQGPHTYVSAAWYSVQSAPTWNYITVQAYGKAKLVEDRAELYELLKTLVDSQEKDSGRDQGYRLESLPADLMASMMNAIIGFRIEVTRTECAAKLSQNRSSEDHGTIAGKLNERGDADSVAIAREMERRGRQAETPRG